MGRKALLATAAVAAGLSGCGGDDRPPAPGRAVFARSCGGCHTLAEAGTKGNRGPNFDSSERLSEAQIRRQLTLGVGGMPSFRGRLTARQQAAVAAFLAAAMRERPSKVDRRP